MEIDSAIEIVPCELCPLGEIPVENAEEFYCYGCRSYICQAHTNDPDGDHVPLDHGLDEGE